MAARTKRVPAGVLFIPFCFAEAAANILTNPQLDPFGKIPEFKYCAARLEPPAVPAAAEVDTTAEIRVLERTVVNSHISGQGEMRPWRGRGSSTRSVVLQAALEVFRAKGFDGATLSELEHATGLGRGSLYGAFGDKRALFLKVLGR